MTLTHRLLLGLSVLLLVLTAGRGDDPKEEPKVKLTEQEQAIFELTNKEREKEHLPPVKLNPVLTRAARAHAQNMARQGKLEHVLDDKKPHERVSEAGYEWAWTGENIAQTSGDPPEKIIELWMNSKGHKENILRDKFTEIGIGMARSEKGEIYYTQVFGAPKKK